MLSNSDGARDGSPEAGALATVSHLDSLVLAGAITGYTVEADASYLFSNRPTLTYRMYRNGPGLANARSFSLDMRELGAEVTASLATGNLRAGETVRRSDQITLAARFPVKASLVEPIALICARYHALGPRSVRASWQYPDVRVSGCPPPSGMISAFGHFAQTALGTAVTLTLDRAPVLPGFKSVRVAILSVWIDLLATARAGPALDG